MTASAADRRPVLDEALQGISHIATLPETTLKIIELVEDPSSTAQDLHQVVSFDPALSTRILKVVNSAFYGLPGQIGSINRAIVLLGLNAVKNIAIAASLAKLFRGGELCPQFNAKDLWRHSVAAAVASKMIADNLRLGLPDEAFLAGLLHDIGIVVEMQFDRQKLIDVINSLNIDAEGVPQEDMLAAEERIFGATHQEFGQALCEKWKFPQAFRFVTGRHHDPLSLGEEHRTLASVVYVADRLCAELSIGFRLDIRSTDIDPAVTEDLGLTAAMIDDVRAGLPAKIEEAEAMLG
ncbi:MAG: HDOD domain-containing protein [Planctomycetota bacterium]|nr:MAG: HDOD domain-containing protein [Planctomycetota bacterium]